MKIKDIGLWLLTIGIVIVSSSCENNNDIGLAPNLPPQASMIMDFDDFNNIKSKSIASKNVKESNVDNWLYSKVVIGVWNTALFTTLAVPVASFNNAFNHTPIYKGGTKWEWSYSVNGFTNQYNARLTGEIIGNEVHWEMFIEKLGIDAFDEFKWFSGVSKIDGKNGYWILNHSSAFPEEMLKIDWMIEGEEVSMIKYTYNRELNDDRNTDQFKSSHITYGLQNNDFDAYYDVYVFNENENSFVEANIQWNRTKYNGRVMAPYFFEDDEWHCWNSDGENAECE